MLASAGPESWREHLGALQSCCETHQAIGSHSGCALPARSRSPDRSSPGNGARPSLSAAAPPFAVVAHCTRGFLSTECLECRRSDSIVGVAATPEHSFVLTLAIPKRLDIAEEVTLQGCFSVPLSTTPTSHTQFDVNIEMPSEAFLSRAGGSRLDCTVLSSGGCRLPHCSRLSKGPFDRRSPHRSRSACRSSVN